MRKKSSKLREKATRVPSIQLERKEDVIREYIARINQRPELSEYARGVAFVQLLKDLLLDAAPQFLQEYLQGMEHTLPGPKTTLYNRGRVDALYGNLVIEFKRSLAKSLQQAKDQLRKYLAILHQNPEDRHRPLIAVATDGIRFSALAPRFNVDAATLSPEEIQLEEIESVDLSAVRPEEAYYWLDRYFTRQTGPIAPKTKQIVKDFGPTSGAFVHAMNVLDGLWKRVEGDSESQVFFDNWQKYLRITYGGPVADRELFLRHTYLATLAKLMVWVRLTAASEPPKDQELRSVLNGHYFNQRGIHNFLEEDFFAWVARDTAWPRSLTMSRWLLVQLATYNLRELSEDVLKGLYEMLVDPKDRHDLGEYYTPDWLATKIVERCLRGKPESSVLDPACGSGTFLYQAIRFKKDQMGQTAKTLKHIEENVVGMDIHPLAVIVAKTTYLLGLGDLLEKRVKAIRIPVYLADSIRPPEEKLRKKRQERQGDLNFTSPLYVVPLDGDGAEFPEDLALKGELYDRAIELCTQYAHSTATVALPSQREFANFLRRSEPALEQDPVWLTSLYHLFKLLRNRIRDRKDTIWAFVLKNVFKPLLMRERFDVVMGNPPWLSYHYIERGSYQEFLKQEITKHYQLVTGRPELLTHMELGTLFFLRSTDLYLHDGGKIGFVLPKSIFVADQHHGLREGSHTAPLRLTEAWDLESVRPLFNVPAAVALGQKSAEKTEWPLAGLILSGELSGKNIALDEAEHELTERETKYWLSIKGRRSYLSEKKEKPVTQGSPYGKEFAEGATIFPRSFWFVEIQKTAGLGVDPARPYVKTDRRAIKAAKDQYKDVCLEGNVEAEFLYQTLLSTDLVPFGHLPSRTVVLPIVWKGDRYGMITAAEARKQGYLGLAEWLEKCEKMWKAKRAEKAERENIYDWLDYRKKLTDQRRKRYTVVYPDVNRIMLASVTEGIKHLDAIDRDARGLPSMVIESAMYHFDTDDREEAFYLSSWLNSPMVDRLLQPFRRKAQSGHPHIHKKVWEIPIPTYNPKIGEHKRLAWLGIECSESTSPFIANLSAKFRTGSLGQLRNLVREKLQQQIVEIDSLVSRIL